jgi:hypothetical protein
MLSRSGLLKQNFRLNETHSDDAIFAFIQLKS